MEEDDDDSDDVCMRVLSFGCGIAGTGDEPCNSLGDDAISGGGMMCLEFSSREKTLDGRTQGGIAGCG